jgi:glycosyltransferase involved in cell wall biosynthesis
VTVPRVSVVVPARNAAPWIREALTSALAHAGPRADLEILVVDDGSTDDTVAIARDVLATGGVEHQVLTGGNGTGPAATRNRGWPRARAPWIQFLDADDIIAPGKIAHQLAVAERAPGDVALVFSPWGRLVARGGAWATTGDRVHPVIGADPLRDVLAPDNFIATGSQIVRGAWLERLHGFVETHRLLEDVDLLMRIVMAGGRLVEAASDEQLFWYRRHPTSASRRNRLAFAHAEVRNGKAAEAHWRAISGGALTSGRAEFLADLYFDAARVLAQEHDPAFDALTAHILTLAPSFTPKAPALLRELSRIVGYRRAERFAVSYRRLKRVLSGR